MVEELGFDEDKWPWFLLLMFLPLPFTIWLSLIFTDFPVSVLSLLQASVTVLLRDQFSLGGIQLWRAVVQGQLWGADRNQKNPVPS